MRVKLAGLAPVAIDGEFIRLDALLKFCAAASTGGEAKIMIQEGGVFLNGEACFQRGRKVRPGDVVRCRGALYRVTKI